MSKQFTQSELEQQSARVCALTSEIGTCKDPAERKVLRAQFQKEYDKFAAMDRRRA